VSRALWLTLALMAAGLFPRAARAERFAVVIGNNEGDESDELLRWAEHDASRTRSLLIDLGDIPSERAVLLLGKSASEVRAALAELRRRIAALSRESEATVFVYYSGHGDVDSLHLRGSSLRLEELSTLLTATRATTLITIVDSCRDEPVRSKGARHAPPFDVRLAHDAGPRGRVTITSSARNELAQESDQLRSSFFTHHLLSGMRGAADRDGDRQVSLSELYRYAYHHTLATSHAHLASVQHPQLEVALEGEGELVVTHLSRADAVLVLPEVLAGDCLIIDLESGQVVAQLYKSKGAEARVALPAGRFSLQVRDGGALYAAELGLEWGGTSTLRVDMLRRQALRDTVSKGAGLRTHSTILSADARLGRPMAASVGVLLAGAVRAALDLEPLRLVADVGTGIARAESALQARDYHETRFGLGVGPRFRFAPLTLFIGAGAGVLWIRERATRVAADGANELFDVDVHTRADALGGYLGPQLDIELPLAADFLLVLHGELPVTAIRIDRELAWKLTPAVGLGAGRRF